MSHLGQLLQLLALLVALVLAGCDRVRHASWATKQAGLGRESNLKDIQSHEEAGPGPPGEQVLATTLVQSLHQASYRSDRGWFFGRPRDVYKVIYIFQDPPERLHGCRSRPDRPLAVYVDMIWSDFADLYVGLQKLTEAGFWGEQRKRLDGSRDLGPSLLAYARRYEDVSKDERRRTKFVHGILRRMFQFSGADREELFRQEVVLGALVYKPFARSQAKSKRPPVFSCYTYASATAESGWASSPLAGADFGTHFVTYNEDTKSQNHAYMWNAVFDAAEQAGVTLLATCQTEATKSVHEILADEESLHANSQRWSLVGHGQHWGGTTGGANGQILNIFLKKTAALSATSQHVHHWWKKTTNIVFKNDWFLEAEVELPYGQLLLASKAARYETSGTGKGGIVATVELPAVGAERAHRIAFVCAHFDSQSQKKREEQVEEWMRSVVLDEKDIRPPGQVLFFGDLNYRLYREAMEDAGVPLGAAEAAYRIYSRLGRAQLKTYDPLGEWDFPAMDVDIDKKLKAEMERAMALKSIIVTPAYKHGLGMRCNQPHRHYGGTYKFKPYRPLKNGSPDPEDACIKMHSEACRMANEGACAEVCGDWGRALACNACTKVEKDCQSWALRCYGIKAEYEPARKAMNTIAANVAQQVLNDLLLLGWQDPVDGKWYVIVSQVRGTALEHRVRRGDLVHKLKTENQRGKKDPCHPVVRGAMGDAPSGFSESDKDAVLAPGGVLEAMRGLEGNSTCVPTVRFTRWKPPDWDLKENTFLQYGWLDRLCYQSWYGSAEIRRDWGLVDAPDSDHMPVTWDVKLSRAARVE